VLLVPRSFASLDIMSRLDGLEEGDPPSIREPGTLYIFSQVGLQRVVAGHLVELADCSPILRASVL